MEKKHYGAIDGLRMIAAFGIVMMHMRANNNYEISGFVYNNVCIFVYDSVCIWNVLWILSKSFKQSDILVRFLWKTF